MKRYRLSSFFAAGLLAVIAGCAPEAPAPAAAETDAPAEQLALERRISPPVWIEGEGAAAAPLADRMAQLSVPAVSVAVYRNGELHWAEGYGASTDEETLFQAASLSKMVAATGIVALAREKGVSLDADISASLPGLDMATLNPGGAALTLRALLSHTNGATVSGFPGYPAGQPVPSTLQVITGSDITNTAAVVIRPNPDAVFSYSGGGYTIAQYWAEQVSGEDFAALMKRLVLAPVGMTQSTFEQPLPDTLAAGNVATGHDAGGAEIPGRWHTHPELAAAGLWTTPSEFGRFLLALGKASKGEAGTGIDPAVAAEVTAPVVEDYGLGVGFVVWGDEKSLQHSGGNVGYRCHAMGLPERGDVIVTMTNSDVGTRLYNEILKTAREIYGWPSDEPEARARVAVSDEELAVFAGAYAPSGSADIVVELTADGGDLTGTTPMTGAFRMVPVGADVFVDAEDGFEISFDRTGETVRLMVEGQQFQKVAPE